MRLLIGLQGILTMASETWSQILSAGCNQEEGREEEKEHSRTRVALADRLRSEEEVTGS
jgi:hypothetical protein